MSGVKIPIIITEEYKKFKMSKSIKYALLLVGGCFTWLLGLILGHYIILAVFTDGYVLQIIWGILMFISLLASILYYIDHIT